MRKLSFLPLSPRLWVGLAIAVLLGVAGGWACCPMGPRETTLITAAPSDAPNKTQAPAGPPWIYGRPDARFTVVEFADLECPYCRVYFPVLKGWIDDHPDVNWQWQHLPLPMHDPAATTEARIVECAGETGGQAAFWKAVTWIYSHTRSDGQGLPPGVPYPDLTPDVQRCLGSDRSDAAIRAQSAEAARLGIQATPTLQVRDRLSGHSIVLPGPVDGDALLSAIDRLEGAATESPIRQASHHPKPMQTPP